MIELQKQQVKKKMSDRPVKDMFEAWLLMSDIPKGTDLILLRGAWYNGASALLQISKKDPTNKMRDKVFDDLNKFPNDVEQLYKKQNEKQKGMN